MSGEEFNNIYNGKAIVAKEWEDFELLDQFFNANIFSWTNYFALVSQIVAGAYAIFFFLMKYLLVQDPITGNTS